MNASLRRKVLLLGVVSSTLLLGGCSLFGHSKRCREPDVSRNAVNLPPLKVPPGADAPDTRNAVKVPPLDVPAQPRSPGDGCLSAPPQFKSAS
jgi:uncharacterized lipoprotein